MIYQTILFDLDGTLTDPGEGITRSVAYALSKWGIEVKDRTVLYCFIGPPLAESFSRYYGFSSEQAEEAVAQYRVYFRERGMFENRVYGGIRELLARLKEAGCRLVIATSKPEEFARRILAHFDLDRYFDQITGASMDGKLSRKGDVITRALALGGIKAEDAVMIGDRHHDIDGAKENGLRSIGVLYGYGDRTEHEAAGTDAIAETVEELERLLLADHA